MDAITKKRRAMDRKLLINLERNLLIQNGALDILSQYHEFLKESEEEKSVLSQHLLSMKPYLVAINQTELLIDILKKEYCHDQ